MEQIEAFVNEVNGYLFHEYVLFALLGTGLLFTIWTAFGQYRAITHGAAVIRGKYDDKGDPGAINHFQALSTALSATVGLGNIAGVAVAVALGGPGAVFWMWVIGILGMALKMTEVTQSMLYRNTENPSNPHGGPMFVAQQGFAKMGLKPLGTIIGGIFVVTLIISAITGGNMFQAWNVANTTRDYFGVNQLYSGVILAVVVAVVIIGGIKVIGRVASIIVPFMCVVYLIAGLYVLVLNIGDVPSMLATIVKAGLGLEEQSASGAFIGGSFGYAFLWGVKRALFSSEAGQGSAPIAHSAAKTDEPVREGVVAGLEPLIDTIIVCTVTALVIMSSGAYNRPAEAVVADAGMLSLVPAVDDEGGAKEDTYTLPDTPVVALPPKTEDARRIAAIDDGVDWVAKETMFVRYLGSTDEDSGTSIKKLTGKVENVGTDDVPELVVKWGEISSDIPPTLVVVDGVPDTGIYGDYAGSSLTAHAFDRVQPGLGKWLVSIAIWLFAISTMISWSYYGEQGVIWVVDAIAGSDTAGRSMQPYFVYPYKLIYCIIIAVTCIPNLITTDIELDMWTSLGLGVMLVVNIPLMWVFAPQAMKAYHNYIGRLKRGELDSHENPKLSDVVSGHDVE
ncbi:MAG: amino acid carrier protein [Planctomycetota bacterium]